MTLHLHEYNYPMVTAPILYYHTAERNAPHWLPYIFYWLSCKEWTLERANTFCLVYQLRFGPLARPFRNRVSTFNASTVQGFSGRLISTVGRRTSSLKKIATWTGDFYIQAITGTYYLYSKPQGDLLDRWLL